LNETIFLTNGGLYIEAMNYDVKKLNWGLYEGALLFWSSVEDITGASSEYSNKLDSQNTVNMTTLIDSYINPTDLASYSTKPPNDN